MKNKWEDSTRKRNIQDRAYDLLGEMILEREAKELMEELRKEWETDKDSEMEAFFTRNEMRYFRQIDKACQKSKKNHIVRLVLPKLPQIAALFIIVVFLMGSFTVALSEEVRVQLLQLLSLTTTQYTVLQLVPDKTVEVPAAWSGGYYMSWIPEGMTLAQCHEAEVMYWRNGQKDVSIDFSVHGLDSSVAIDTEEAYVQSVMVQGNPGYMAIKDTRIMIYWQQENQMLMLITRGFDEDTARMVADKIISIK